MPNKNRTADAEQIVKRLDAIVALLVRAGDKKVGDRIVTLKNAGLRPIEMSRILGKPLSYVTATITMTEKSGNKKSRGGGT